MEESTWYIKQRSQLEESLWQFKQRSRVLRDYQQDTQRVWQDDAATEINGRYFRPHEEDSQQSLSALSMQLQLLNETDTKLQMAGQSILEANRLSEEIEKLINFANQDISRSHSEYSVFQEQNSAARSEIPIITQLINQANSCCG
jgi:hypothetical protein